MTTLQKIRKFFTLKETSTLIVSLIGGYLLNEIGKQDLSVRAICILVILALLCLVVIAGEILNLNKFADSVDDSVKGFENKIESEVKKVVNSIKELERKFTIEINYVERVTAEDEAAMYQEFKKLIMNADESILVVNSFLVEHIVPIAGVDERDVEVARKARDEYYEALLKKAEGGKVEYKRVVQVKDDDSTLSELQRYNQVQIKHFLKMMDYMKRLPNVALKRAPAQRLSTFVLIDYKYLIWQINEIVIQPKREDIRLHGAFIIDDPNRQITPHFYRFYKILDGQSSSMSPEDLRVIASLE